MRESSDGFGNVTVIMFLMLPYLQQRCVLSIMDPFPPFHHPHTSGPVIDERPKGPIEKRKRNLKFFSPVSREERETGNSFRQFREGKENSKRICSTFERRKRNGFSMLKLREEKEKVKTISPFSRREREMLNPVPLF